MTEPIEDTDWVGDVRRVVFNRPLDTKEEKELITRVLRSCSEKSMHVTKEPMLLQENSLEPICAYAFTKS